MKKTILTFTCILGLGLSYVLGANTGMDAEKRGMSDNKQGAGAVPDFQKKNYLKDFGNYVDAYQYFKAIASSPKPSNKKAVRAVTMAERVVQRQDKFLNRISTMTQKLKNVEALRDLGDKISTRLAENKSEMEEIAKYDIMKANQGDASFLWQNMRRYGVDMRIYSHRLRDFVKHLHRKMHVMDQKVSITMEGDVGDDDEVMMDLGYEDVDQE